MLGCLISRYSEVTWKGTLRCTWQQWQCYLEAAPAFATMTRILDHSTQPGQRPLMSLQVLPKTQPVLPCLLRRLLHQERQREAYTLARRHAGAPHFARSLEWLLFTSLEINMDSFPSPNKARAKQHRQDGRRGAGPLLTSAADLLRRFPQVLSTRTLHVHFFFCPGNILRHQSLKDRQLEVFTLLFTRCMYHQ